MPSHRVAYGKGVNILGTTAYVIIRKNTSGTDLATEFDLGSDGYKITYQGPSNSQLLPGIYPTDVEVTTYWKDITRLETLLLDIASSSDGDFFIEIASSLTSGPYRCFVLLPESITVADDYENARVTFRASDGMAMLKNTPYNNDGEPYTDHASVLQHLLNVQSKLLVFERLNEFFGTTNTARLRVQDNAVSVDDANYSLHPPALNGATVQRTRIHHRTFHKKNANGVNEYYSCWDVLNSLCLTFGWQVWNRMGALWVMNVFDSASNLTGWLYRYDGTTNSYTISDGYIAFNGKEGLWDNHKGGNWSRTYTPPSGDVTLTRITQGSQGVIYSTNDASGTTLYDTDEYYGIRESLTIRGSIRVIKDADTSFSSGAARLWRYVPTFNVRLGMDGGTNYYLHNIVTASQTPNMTAVLNEDTAFQNTVNYHHLHTPGITGTTSSYEWNTSTNSKYKYRTPMSDGRFWFLHDASQDIDVVIPFEFTVETPLVGDINKQGLQITSSLIPYDWEGQPDTTHFDGATVNFVEVGVYRRDKDELQQTDSFTYRAKMSSGRNKLDLGETLIGDRGASTYFGGIEVYDGTDWVPSSGWVNQDQSTPRPINQMAVEEVSAHHKKAKQIEQGTIVQNGQYYVESIVGVNWKDVDTGIIYAPLGFTTTFTPATTDVTLFRVGRNFLDIDVYVDEPRTDPTNNYVKPSGGDAGSVAFQTDTETGGLIQSYHNRAELIGSNWSPANVIDGATLEYYYTVNVDGIGIWANHQGEIPTTNFDIQRKVYLVDEALANGASSGWSSPAGAQPAANETLAATLENVQDHLAKLTNAAATYTIIVAYDEVSTQPLLNTYSGAVAAYGLRKLRTAYTGSAIQVRRTTPSAASTDIGFTAQGELDTAALVSFCGSGDGYIQKWYDQAGSNDLLQSSTASQPQIYSSGATITLNGKPAIQFDGSTDSLPASTSFDINTNVNELVVAWVGSTTDLATNQSIVSQWKQGVQANQVMEIMHRADTDYIRYMHRYSNGTLSTVDSGTAITSGAQYIVVGHTEQNKNEAWFEGTKQTGASVNAAPNNATEGFRIGARSDGAINPHEGKTQEVVIWSTTTHNHDAANISDTLNDYYASY